MGCLTYILTFLLAALGASKFYIKLRTRWCKSQVCLKGKTTIVTGANCGIGYVTALDFAMRGARVIIGCRNKTKAEEARKKIIKETGNEHVIVKIIDLASFDSVRAFAKDIIATEDRLDILVNNAGAFGLGDEKTVDGLPLIMQVNYFSNVLLTLLLIGLLKKSGASRIVNVSSYAANVAYNFKLDDIDRYVPNNDDYYNSKLCNVLFTIELAKKLQGSKITTYSLHPGFIASEIFHNLSGFLRIVYYVSVKLFSISCEEGAQTTIYCSVAKGLEQHSGQHFERCQKVGRPKTASDPQLAKKLWERTMALIGLKESENPFTS